MTRQSLSRFLSDRRELRTFMTLPSNVGEAARAAGKEARKLFAPRKPVNHTKTQLFRQKLTESVVKRGMPALRPLLVALSLTAVAACARQPAPAPATSPPAQPGPQASVPLPPLPAIGGDEKFQTFIRNFEATAIARGVTPETYNKAVAGIAPIAAIDTIVAEQPEFVRPVWAYLDSAVSAKRITEAKFFLNQNGALLDTIQTRYGVPKEILVSIWSMETDFGRYMGTYNLFAALATQAYDGPRQGFAQRELIAALLLLQQNNYVPSEMVSSWAGAF